MTQMTLITNPMTNPVTLDVVVMSESSRTDAMRIWNSLESQIGSGRLMSSAIWTETWLNHFGKEIPHQFLVANRNGEPRGICLLTRGVGQRNGPVRTHTLHVGTSGEPEADSVCVEYNTLLVHNEDRLPFQKALWKHIESNDTWDEFRLDGFEEHDVLEWIQSDPRWSFVTKPARYFDLTLIRDNGCNVLNTLGTQTRSAVRKSLRLSGNHVCEWAETTAQAESIFHELIELHQARWQSAGHPGCYSSRRFKEFHFELLNRLVPLGLMGLFRVRNEAGTIGCDQVFIDNNRACLYQGGRILPADHRISTGVIVDYLLIEECRRRRLDAVDFLAGDSPHKRRLSTDGNPLVWAVIRRPRLKHQVIDGLRSIKNVIQQTFFGAGTTQAKMTDSTLQLDGFVQ